MERRLTTIISADSAGYSRLMERDEGGTLAELLDRQSSVIAPFWRGSAVTSLPIACWPLHRLGREPLTITRARYPFAFFPSAT